MKAAWSRFVANEWLFAGVMLLVTVALLFGHTLNVPMYLDDHGAILENHRLRDLPATLAQLFSQRGLTNLTFALNSRLTGWSLPPLHLTNIALHALCSILVWHLLRQLANGRGLVLLGALLFAAHPLQTQAVTYLVQRAAVLGAVFFVAAVLCHRRARAVLAAGATRLSQPYLCWHGGAVLLGGAAILAKEHTVTLPLLLIAHDRFFPSPPERLLRQCLVDYLPYVVISVLAGGGLLLSLNSAAEFAGLSAPLAGPSLYYLVTQFSVFWVYLRLLLLPYGQALEHDFPLATNLLAGQSLLALAGLLFLGSLLWRLRHRRPLLVFGATWFVVGLSVESSIIPLDPLFEHRLYLPMVGFVMVLVDGLPALLGARRACLALTLALLVCLPLTLRRNALWSDPLRFNEHDLVVAPHSERVHQALIFNYRDAGRTADAERLCRDLLQLHPESVVAFQELALLQASRGDLPAALDSVEEGLRWIPAGAGLYKTGAQLHMQNRQPDAAVAFLERGIVAAPRNPAMYDQYAALHFELGNLQEAEQGYLKSLALDDRRATARRNLAKVYYSQGRMDESLGQLHVALQIEPGNPDAWEGVGMTALAIGNREQMLAALRKLERIDAEGAKRLLAAMAASGFFPGEG